jgi:hypothetical protein
VRDEDGRESFHISLVLAQELSARGQIVVHDIKDFSVYALLQTG